MAKFAGLTAIAQAASATSGVSKCEIAAREDFMYKMAAATLAGNSVECKADLEMVCAGITAAFSPKGKNGAAGEAVNNSGTPLAIAKHVEHGWSGVRQQ